MKMFRNAITFKFFSKQNNFLAEQILCQQMVCYLK